MYQYNLRPREPAYPARSSYQRDEEVMQALVTAGAMIAIADGSVAPVERDELVNFINQQGFVPSIARARIAAVFDARLRELDDRNGPNVIVEKFRPLAGLSLGSVVMRMAQHVAAADGKLHHRELRTMDLLRLILAKASLSGRRGESRLLQPVAAAPRMLEIEAIALAPSNVAPRAAELSLVRVVRGFLRSSLPIAAVGLGLLASAAWTALLGYWAFRMMRWTVSNSFELLL